jgi:esterase/lipase
MRTPQTLKNILLYAISLSFILMANKTMASLEGCLTLEQNIIKKDVVINSDYIQKDPASNGIRANNRSFFLAGTNGQGVLLQHGFIASPFEVQDLARKLNSEGYTVYAPLLYGYGSSTSIANMVDSEGWKQGFLESVELFRECFTQIHLVGFSLGGGLSAAYAYQFPEEIKSLVLLSPYFGVGIPKAKELLEGLNAIYKSDRIAFDNLPAFGDLKAIKLNSLFYNEDLPLNSAKNLITFGEELQNVQAFTPKAQFPVLLQYSEDDASINKELAVSWTKEHFKHSFVNSLSAELKIPHQLLVSDVNSFEATTIETIVYFIKNGQFNTSNDFN